MSEQGWEIFVETYSNWILYKLRKLNQRYCHFYKLCILVLSFKHKDVPAPKYKPKESYCDECIDLYLWAFQYLWDKLKKFRGSCKQSVFIWQILNSKYFAIEMLRQKFGPDNPPAVIKVRGKVFCQVYKYLRYKKDADYIRFKLNLPREEVKQTINKIRDLLAGKNLIYLIEEVTFTGLFAIGADGIGKESDIESPIPSQEDAVINKQIADKVSDLIGELSEDEQLLIKLRYYEGMSVNEVLEFLNGRGIKLNAWDIGQLDLDQLKYIYRKILEGLRNKLGEDDQFETFSAQPDPGGSRRPARRHSGRS